MNIYDIHERTDRMYLEVAATLVGKPSAGSREFATHPHVAPLHLKITDEVECLDLTNAWARHQVFSCADVTPTYNKCARIKRQGSVVTALGTYASRHIAEITRDIRV